MFTVRVEPERNLRTVYECRKYKVRRDGKKAIISIDEGEGFKDLPPLINGGTAYVMNEQGVTVDVIKTR